jgi:hypothetical protein
MATVTTDDKLTFPLFRKFLDLNPALRGIIKESLKP